MNEWTSREKQPTHVLDLEALVDCRALITGENNNKESFHQHAKCETQFFNFLRPSTINNERKLFVLTSGHFSFVDKNSSQDTKICESIFENEQNSKKMNWTTDSRMIVLTVRTSLLNIYDTSLKYVVLIFIFFLPFFVVYLSHNATRNEDRKCTLVASLSFMVLWSRIVSKSLLVPKKKRKQKTFGFLLFTSLLALLASDTSYISSCALRPSRDNQFALCKYRFAFFIYETSLLEAKTIKKNSSSKFNVKNRREEFYWILCLLLRYWSFAWLYRLGLFMLLFIGLPLSIMLGAKSTRW